MATLKPVFAPLLHCQGVVYDLSPVFEKNQNSKYLFSYSVSFCWHMKADSVTKGNQDDQIVVLSSNFGWTYVLKNLI